MYPSDLLYSEDHEWIRVEGDECVLGITEFAQDELGEIVFVELPDVGDTFDAGDEIGTVESVKAVAEIMTPVGGEILAVNEALADAPEAVNSDAHGGGWMVKLKIDPEDEALGSLMDASAYQTFIDGD
jgi:glycine cleavage system H protein